MEAGKKLRKKRGRPEKYADSTQVSIRMPATLLSNLRQQADAKGSTVTSIILKKLGK